MNGEPSIQDRDPRAVCAFCGHTQADHDPDDGTCCHEDRYESRHVVEFCDCVEFRHEYPISYYDDGSEDEEPEWMREGS